MIPGVKRLLILRHAKSSWADSALDDWQRPLNDRGQRDAPRAGEWLGARSRVPDRIITSDAVRARTTAHAVAEAAGYSGEIVIEPSLYLATPQAMFAVLNFTGTFNPIAGEGGLRANVQESLALEISLLKLRL